MTLYSNGVRSRVAIARLLIKMDEHPEYSEKIGMKDISCFRSEAGNEEKEGQKDVNAAICYFDCRRAV